MDPSDCGRDRHLDAEIAQAIEQAASDAGLVAAIEVAPAEVVIGDTALEHEIDRAEHRRGDGDDRFLWSAPAS